MALKNPLRETLYQVFVDDAEDGTIPVSPKVGYAMAERLAGAVHSAIAAKQRPTWSNPHIVRAQT